MIFNATTFAARTAGVTNEWDDFTNATPVTDVNAAVMAIWQACGLWANEGQAVSISSIWSDEYAMVARIAETDNIEASCLARTLHWGEDGSKIGGTIETYYEDQSRGDVCRVRHEVEEKIIFTEAGYLLSNITT